MLHFDEYAYTGTSDTVLYKFMDALAGTTGAGALVNEIFLARMGGALETTYFNELDFIFGKISFLARSPAESYTYNPLTDQLTSDQWDEVRVKDAWFRARIKDFFKACSLGGTPDGIRMCITAALAVDCDIYEVWRYKDNFGQSGAAWAATWPSGIPVTVTDNLGRSPSTARNEVVIRPHKGELAPEELRLCRDMLGKLMPMDVISTVNTVGLAVMSPQLVAAVSSDSTYFEIQRVVTATPVLAELPAPELLPIDLLPSEQWLYSAQSTPTTAPYTAFNISQEYGYYYLVGGGKRSPIDSVQYGTLQDDGTVKTENDFQIFNTTGQYSPKSPYALADSPDNYPGGKYGIHPSQEPALNPDGSQYTFTWPNQAAFIASEAIRVQNLGGVADADGFRLPITAATNSARKFTPDMAISYFPPSKDSDVTTSLTRRRTGNQTVPELRDPVNFVRST